MTTLQASTYGLKSDRPAEAEAECLLAIAPGAFLPAEAFHELSLAAQEATPHLRLWCGVLNADVRELLKLFTPPESSGQSLDAAFQALSAGMKDIDGYNQLLQQLLDQAQEAGWSPRGAVPGVTGRVTNLVVLCQSAGSMGFAPVSFKRAAALVLLASVINTSDHMKRKVMSVEAWPSV
ncbi:hypothetical protein GPECTOR_2g1439 [Gonium pectorale]|uniref:Uncharacterized protein n=1 Tax=Gonium pectorale TaxID=33097 RepID=A0A150H224_GONPE|nr:hypothetical protein GPECTOR_2g1439 [Gonium pectorale]|eukprot:KXZ55888.1 hypothetical protein GPECTOR_2g1439 [Gonium pectorale]